jgi:hypothetical protein
LIEGESREKYFLIADSCWLSKSFREDIMPHRMANIIMDNSKEYKNTLHKIHTFHKENPEINILPSHCSEVFDKFVKNSG